MGRPVVQNKLTSPELLEQINTDNRQNVVSFLEYLRSINRSEGTIRGYKNDLDIFMVYLFHYCNNKNFKDVVKRDIVGFQNWLLVQNKNSPARVNRLRSSVSSLMRYLNISL